MTEENDANQEVVLRSGFGPPMPCPYLEGLEWRNEVLMPETAFNSEVHEILFDAGYRRVGQSFFRPICEACSACKSLRVPVDRFKRSKSQRRVWNRNRDVVVKVEALQLDDEKEELLFRYLETRHPGWEPDERHEIVETLFRDPPENCRFTVFRADQQLMGVGIVSVTPAIVSSDYFYFEPEFAERSPGVFSMLWEIEWARQSGRRWYHPGFYVAGCPSMSYKAQLAPAEILSRDGFWSSFEN